MRRRHLLRAARPPHPQRPLRMRSHRLPCAQRTFSGGLGTTSIRAGDLLVSVGGSIDVSEALSDEPISYGENMGSETFGFAVRRRFHDVRRNSERHHILEDRRFRTTANIFGLRAMTP